MSRRGNIGAGGAGAAAGITNGGVVGVVLLQPAARTTFATIAGALAAAAGGDTVKVGPGTYPESVTVPASVNLESDAWASITGAAPGGTRVTLSLNSTIRGFSVTLPNDAAGGIVTSAASATVTDCRLIGTGVLGTGIANLGAGTLACRDIQYMSGTCDNVMATVVGGGLLIIDGLFVAVGTIGSAVLVNNSGSVHAHSVQIGPVTGTITNGFECGPGQLTVSDATIEGCTNGISIIDNSAIVHLSAVHIDNSVTNDILVDPVLVSGTYHAVGCSYQESMISAPTAWKTGATIIANYQDEFAEDQAFKCQSELHVGSPEKGTEAVFGEGDSYTREMVVLTTDGTAGVGDGAGFVDESAAASSPTGSTLSFQGLGANHSILFCTTLQDIVGLKKHWGLKVLQTVAANIGGDFVWELWDGAAWTPFGVLSTHSDLFHRYANEVLIRTNTSEQIRYGVDSNAAWATKNINGTTGYWSRLRNQNILTTAPVFQQFKLHSSRTELNADGTQEYFGNARFKRTIQSTGNVFGESGAVADANPTIGSGGVPTGWAHIMKNSRLNGSGDAIYGQFDIPRGLDTSFPLTFDFHMLPATAPGAPGNTTWILSVLPIESVNVMEADPTGGTTPITRTIAQTEVITSKVATLSATVPVLSTDLTRIQEINFGLYDISGYYESDTVYWRLEMDSAGAAPPGAVDITMAEISGVFWTNGEKL